MLREAAEKSSHMQYKFTRSSKQPIIPIPENVALPTSQSHRSASHTHRPHTSIDLTHLPASDERHEIQEYSSRPPKLVHPPA